MADKKTSKSFILGIATNLLLIKSVVKAHVRKTRGGKVVQVKEYSDARKKKTEKEKGLPNGTEVVFRPKGAVRARRGVIVGAKAENYHIKGKRGNEGQVINYILPKSQVISLKAFQEKSKKETRYTKGDKISAHRVVTPEESLKRSEKGTKRLGMTEEDILTNDRIKGYIINRVHRLAKQNNMDTSFDPSGKFIRVHDDDYADMVSEYAIGMLNALRREAAQAPDKDIQEFKDHLAGKRDKSRIFISMSREGKNSALQVVNTQNKRRKEHVDIQSGEEDPGARRNLAALSSAPEHERFALPPKEKAIEKFLSRIPSTDADLIGMKFGLGDNEPHTNEQIAEKLKEKGTKYQGEYAWTRNNVADAVKDALVKMRDLGGIEDLQDYMKSMREALDLRKSVSSGHKTICVDFDGVIADYSKGLQGNDVFGDPLPGAVEAMKRLKEFGFKLIVFTARQDTPALRAYLDRNVIPYDSINYNSDQPEDANPGKPIADIYLDDRAVRFTDWDKAVSRIWKITFDSTFGDMMEKSETYHLYSDEYRTDYLRKSKGDSIKSNGIDQCIDCGVDINEINDSKWEAFVDGTITQKICKYCVEKRDDIMIKDIASTYDGAKAHQLSKSIALLLPDGATLEKSYSSVMIEKYPGGKWITAREGSLAGRHIFILPFTCDRSTLQYRGNCDDKMEKSDDGSNIDRQVGWFRKIGLKAHALVNLFLTKSSHEDIKKDVGEPEKLPDVQRGVVPGLKLQDKDDANKPSQEVLMRKALKIAPKIFLLRKSVRMPREERTIIEKFKKLDTPDVAENGYGFFVKWADGRGLYGLKKKADAIAFAEQRDREVVSMVYRKREKGDVVHEQFKKASSGNDMLLLQKAEKAKFTSAQKSKISTVMEEFKAGTLKSSSGEVVTDHKMALAIALSQARNMKKSSTTLTSSPYLLKSRVKAHARQMKSGKVVQVREHEDVRHKKGVGQGIVTLINSLIKEERKSGQDYPRSVAYDNYLKALNSAKGKKVILNITGELDGYLAMGDKYAIEVNPKADKVRKYLRDRLMARRKEVLPPYNTEKLDSYIKKYKEFNSAFIKTEPRGGTAKTLEALGDIRDLLRDPSIVGLYEHTEFPTLKKEINAMINNVKRIAKRDPMSEFNDRDTVDKLKQIIISVISKPINKSEAEQCTFPFLN